MKCRARYMVLNNPILWAIYSLWEEVFRWYYNYRSQYNLAKLDLCIEFVAITELSLNATL